MLIYSCALHKYLCSKNTLLVLKHETHFVQKTFLWTDEVRESNDLFFEPQIDQVGCKDENQAIYIGLHLSSQQTGCSLQQSLLLSVPSECKELPCAPHKSSVYIKNRSPLPPPHKVCGCMLESKASPPM